MRGTIGETDQTAKWVSRRWWDKEFQLVGSGGDKLASVAVRGSSGTANIGDREYRIKRLRWEPTDSDESAITIREAHSEKIVARFAFTGARGLLTAQLCGGEQFRLRWVRWLRKWALTDSSDEVVLSTRKRWSGLELRPAPGLDPYTWLMLGLLDLAVREVSRPWF